MMMVVPFFFLLFFLKMNKAWSNAPSGILKNLNLVHESMVLKNLNLVHFSLFFFLKVVR